MNKKLAGIGVIIGALAALFYVLKAKAKPCEEGTTKCAGPNNLDLYECSEGKWVLVEENSPACGYVPECIEGETKCVGLDLYSCVNEKWTLTEKNATECGYVPEIVEVQLYAGWNYVTYHGKAMPITDAFPHATRRNIQIVYVWSYEIGDWVAQGMVPSTKMIPSGYYALLLWSDCIWTYERWNE